MAAYETVTSLDVEAAIARARDFFEGTHGLEPLDRLGRLQRWRGVDNDTIELRAFPLPNGGSRLELDTLRSDELAREFVRAIPHPGLVDRLLHRVRRHR